MRIVCVDNEKPVLDMTVEMCLSLPQKPLVEAFRTAGEALAHFGQFKADIALLDTDLPDMNGIMLAAQIKELSPDTAIIFLTGHAEYALDAIAMHASGYMMKPVSEERLRAEIDYAVENIKMRKVYAACGDILFSF